METFRSILILSGFFITFLAQIIGGILIFKRSIKKGILTLLIPFYFIVTLRREGFYNKIIGLWMMGLLFIVIGFIILE